MGRAAGERNVPLGTCLEGFVVSYVSLYRRWRPQTFDDIIGQAHVVRTLKNAISAGRTTHAYIFAGPRGTGKTSTARVLAKALNCAKGPTPEPCGECVSCVGIREGAAMDVIEIDAASNRGIDEIRDLREKVMYAPTQGRYKVYIIDEAHMLTQHAFNALLKTLEEPPSHAVFVLATTQAENIIPTIQSRCQRFDFTRLTVSDLAAHVVRVAQAQSIEIDADAARLVARRADGSARDALGLLEQASAWSPHVTVESVLSLLGVSDFDILTRFAAALADDQPGQAFQIIQEAVDSGVDMRQFLQDLILHFRNMLVAKECPGRPELTDVPAAAYAALTRQAAAFPRDRLIRVLGALSEGEAQLRRSFNPRLALEVTVAGLYAPSEQAAQDPPMTPAEPGATRPMARPTARPAAKPAAKPAARAASHRAKQETGPAATAEGDGGDGGGRLSGITDAQWQQALARVKPSNPLLEALLKDVRSVRVEGDLVKIIFDPAWAVHAQRVSEPDSRRLIAQALGEVLGRSVRCESTTARVEAQKESPAPEPSAVGKSGSPGLDFSDVPEVQAAIDLFNPREIKTISD